MKNDSVAIPQHQPVLAESLVKPPMSRTLVYRTNKEFDKCAELLRNILSVQESRRNSKSSTIGEANRKNQQPSQTSTRLKQQNIKATLSKSLFVKTNINNSIDIGERRSSYSPTKSPLPSTGASAIVEDPSLLKNRSSPTKPRKHQIYSSSPVQPVHQRLASSTKHSSSLNNKTRPKSPLSSNRRRHPSQNQSELIRSSSCGDIPSVKTDHQQQARAFTDQYITFLTRIRTISKQIRTKSSNSFSECSHLWNELENLLSSALSHANDDVQLQLSLEPLQNEISELRKQLQTTNVHLRELDTRRHEESYIHVRKQTESCQVQYSQLLSHNQELKTKCDTLQEKVDNLERNYIRLIQRSTQQDLRLMSERTEWVSSDNHFLLREEILLLKQKLYHVYDDLTTVLNRNHSLELSCGEQRQQLLLQKQQFNDLKQTAQHILQDFDKRPTGDKIKRLLNKMISEQQHSITGSSTHHETHVTPTKVTTSVVNSSSSFFDTPHKPSIPPDIQTTINRAQATSIPVAKKLRPKSLFATPAVFNDTCPLSKLEQNRSPTIDVASYTSCSSSTICDAESILSSSILSSSTPLNHPQRKQTNQYNSLPSLNVSQISELPILFDHHDSFSNSNNDSGPEFDHISNLTSKIFSSDEDEDVGLGISATSSSTTVPSDAERLMQM